MSMSDTTLCLHIGLPKTGSTYLQEVFFPSLEHIRFGGIPRSDLFQDEEHRTGGRRTLASCFRRSAALWTDMGPAILEAVLPGPVESLEGHTTVLSDEGVGRTGSRPALFRAHLEGLRRTALDAGFTRFRVLCLVRRQDTWLASHYAQMSDRNATPSQADFVRAIRSILDSAEGRYSFGMLLDYDRLRAELVDVCGADNVLILPHEYLTRRPGECEDEIARFLLPGEQTAPDGHEAGPDEDGERRNTRSLGEGVWKIRSRRHRPVLRLRPGRLFRRLGLPTEIPMAPVDWRRCREIELTDELSREVLQAYAASNRSLASHLRTDLSPYGYVPESQRDDQ